jgi:hypothetical protein
MNPEQPNRIEKMKKAKRAVQQKVFTYIATSFGLIAGLAWNDAVKALIDYLLPSTGNGSIIAKLLYALIVTILVVSVLFMIEKSLAEPEEKQ